MVSSGTLSSLFIDNSTHIHCAARVVDLNSLAQLIIIIILYSLLRYPRQTSHDVDHIGLNKTKKPLIEYPAAVCLKELNADKEAAATTVAREETAQQTETAALSMEVNPQAPPSSDVPVHLMIPSLSAPLPKTKGRFCSPLKDPG